MNQLLTLFSVVLLAVLHDSIVHSFGVGGPPQRRMMTLMANHHHHHHHRIGGSRSTSLFSKEGDETTEKEKEGDTRQSLEEKMKKWEATEEEIKAATLGGVVPGGGDGNRSDAFDVGLYIAFPLMVLSGLAFALFPFLMGNIDVSSVGPPPTS